MDGISMGMGQGQQPAPGMLPGGQPPADEKQVSRDKPDVDKQREELVKGWVERIEASKEFWKVRFAQMRDDEKFASGKKQWPGQEAKDDRYVANVTLRHINQRVASIYAKNPRVRASLRRRLWSVVWDGSAEMVQQAEASVKAAQNPEGYQAALAQGLTQPVTMDPRTAALVIKESQEVSQKKQMYQRMGKTLEIVMHYSLDEPFPRFKPQAKQLVRRTLTTAVGYIKLGYQRVMEQTPDVDAKIKDTSDRLAHLQMLADDLADGETNPNSPEAEELKLNLAALQKQKNIILREGLVFSFPRAWQVIIDHENCTQLKGFVGAEFIAQEYMFTPKQVQKLFGKDIGKNYNPHSPSGEMADKRKKSDKMCAVYEVHDLVGQVCFTVCSGYCDFLKEPGEPDVKLDQFHPYFALSFNDTEDSEDIYPPSDTQQIRPMQVEYNRGREGLRTHRIANTPAMVSNKGVLDDDSKAKLTSHAPHEVIETNLSKNDNINNALMAKPTVPIQPELYEVEGVFTDIQRVQGDQAANLGGTSGSTATESSIAENSRVTTLQSNIDDLDEFLTDVMKAAGQILLLETSKATVIEIAGDGAVWPELTREEAARDLFLEVKAGSSGRPNRAARLSAIEKTAPFLLQVPGVKPKKMAELMLPEIDENLDVDDFYDPEAPSIVAMNAQAKPNLAPGPGNAAQGAMGNMNAAAPAQSAARTQGMHPAPDAAGVDAPTS